MNWLFIVQRQEHRCGGALEITLIIIIIVTITVEYPSPISTPSNSLLIAQCSLVLGYSIKLCNDNVNISAVKVCKIS